MTKRERFTRNTTPRLARTLAAATTLLCISGAFAATAADRKFIKVGDSEGVVLAKIGKPDSETVTAVTPVIVKQLTYLPHSDDHQTLTVITVRAGVVSDVKRSIQR